VEQQWEQALDELSADTQGELAPWAAATARLQHPKAPQHTPGNAQGQIAAKKSKVTPLSPQQKTMLAYVQVQQKMLAQQQAAILGNKEAAHSALTQRTLEDEMEAADAEGADSFISDQE
jgi:hypothetical protein